MVGVYSGGDVKDSVRQSSGTEQMEKVKVEAMGQPSGALPQRLAGRARQVMAATVASSLAFIFGASIGWPSVVQPLLQSDESPVGKLGDEDISWLASLTFLGGITGSFFWSRIADRYGRKVCGYSVTVPFLIGWTLTIFTQDRMLLLVARFINGIGGSGALILSPTYISEITQSGIRGTLGSFVVLYMNAGIVFAYSLGALLRYETLNYTFLALPLLFIAFFLAMPESPQYLWAKGRKEKAYASLLWLRSGDLTCVQDETLSYQSRPQEGNVNYSALVCSRGRRMGMIIGLGLFTWQQFCGILAILSYTSFIFDKSGSTLPPERATIIVGLFQLFASFVSSVIVDRSGRKILLLISYMFMGLALTSIGMYFYLDSADLDVSALSWVPVVSLSLHVLAYALGAGPVPYVVVTETLPVDIRGLATSIIILWGTLLAFISVKIFPLLITFVGISGCFWFFSIFCYTAFLFTWIMVPETKGIPLEEILLRLNGYRGVDML